MKELFSNDAHFETKKYSHSFELLYMEVAYELTAAKMRSLGAIPCSTDVCFSNLFKRFILQRSYELNQQLEKVAKESKHRHKNFDAVYIDCPLNKSKMKYLYNVM